jgi:hypothetical protein
MNERLTRVVGDLRAATRAAGLGGVYTGKGVPALSAAAFAKYAERLTNDTPDYERRWLSTYLAGCAVKSARRLGLTPGEFLRVVRVCFL